MKNNNVSHEIFLPSQLPELTRAIAPYKKKIWKRGKGLKDILTKEELKAVNLYIKTGCYTSAAAKMNTNIPMFYITIKNIIAKLNIFTHLIK